MSEVGILVYAYGVLFLLALIEMSVSYARGDGHYRSSELNASLSMAVVYQLFELFIQGFLYIPYLWLEKVAGTPWPIDRAWAWLLGFIVVDLLGYVSHRMMHEVNILWALHEGHHSGEEFNLGMGARQSFFVGLAQPLFALPLALFMPLEMLVTLHAFELLWALFLHTPYVGKLGLLEEVFATPSHHRVHHGRNAKYIDRNHGNVLILWDRLFGTFQREEETPVYGITAPLSGRGVWEASTHHFYQLCKMTRVATSLPEKLALWFKRPDYRPTGWHEPSQSVAQDLRRYRLPNTQAGLAMKTYTSLHFLAVIAALTWLILRGDSLLFYERVFTAGLMVWAICSLTQLLAAHPRAFQREVMRLFVTASALSAALTSQASMGAWLVVGISLLALTLMGSERSARELTKAKG